MNDHPPSNALGFRRIHSLPASKATLSQQGMSPEIVELYGGLDSGGIGKTLRVPLPGGHEVVGYLVEVSYALEEERPRLLWVLRLEGYPRFLYLRTGMNPDLEFFDDVDDRNRLRDWVGLVQTSDLAGFQDLHLRSSELIPTVVQANEWSDARVLFRSDTGDTLHALKDGSIAWHSLGDDGLHLCGSFADFCRRFTIACRDGEYMDLRVDTEIRGMISE
ncbi:MAG: hypothetical protein AAGG48_18320 [Planctomycetota bacterium]